MHIHNLDQWKTSHDFEVGHEFGERRSRIVLILTALTMVIEIIAGTVFGSMALLVDGWHMATHVAAFGITVFAYRYARKNRDNPDFTFSTGKVSVLGGFASAVALAVVALMMAVESIERLFSPHPIMFNEAIIVAVFGFLVNAVSVFLLHHRQDHDDHEHDHGHHDHNLRAAYFHVLADTLTSILAITALISGKYFGWIWLDSASGIVGAMIIGKWALGLLQDSSPILLDKGISQAIKDRIVSAIESESDNRVVDLHAWYISPNHQTLVISIVTHDPRNPEYYKKRILEKAPFSHITVEVIPCDSEPCVPV